MTDLLDLEAVLDPGEMWSRISVRETSSGEVIVTQNIHWPPPRDPLSCPAPVHEYLGVGGAAPGVVVVLANAQDRGRPPGGPGLRRPRTVASGSGNNSSTGPCTPLGAGWAGCVRPAPGRAEGGADGDRAASCPGSGAGPAAAQG